MSPGKAKSIRILAATFLPHFGVVGVKDAIGPLAPFIMEALGISRAQIGLLASVQYAGSIIMAIGAGSLVERLGIRPFLLFSPFIMGLVGLWFAGITTYSQGLVAYLVGGFLFAFTNPATTKAVILAFPQEQRGTVTGIKQTGANIGGLFATAVLPAIAVAAGWRASLIFIGCTAMTAGLLAWWLYGDGAGRAVERESRRRGSALAGLSELCHNRDFLLLCGLQGFFFMTQITLQAYLVLYLVEVMDYAKVYAGFIAAAMLAVGAASRILWGMMSDVLYHGRRLPTMISMGYISCAGLLALGLLHPSLPVWLVVLAVATAGSGAIGFTGTALLLRAELAGKHLAATATGAGMALSSCFTLIGPPIFGLIVDYSGSYRLGWLLLALIILAATLLLRLIREEVKPHLPAGQQPLA